MFWSKKSKNIHIYDTKPTWKVKSYNGELIHCIGLTKDLHMNELLELCKINGEYPCWNGNYKNRDIKSCLYEMKEYLNKAKILLPPDPPDGSVDYDFSIQYSKREVHTALCCSNALLNHNWNEAMHELSDCIDDYCNGKNPNRLINYAEYTMFLLLINNFICALEFVN